MGVDDKWQSLIVTGDIQTLDSKNRFDECFNCINFGEALRTAAEGHMLVTLASWFYQGFNFILFMACLSFIDLECLPEIMIFPKDKISPNPPSGGFIYLIHYTEN
jgi:hypothetical protein